MTRKEKFKQVIAYFQEHMPIAETELNYETPYQLLVAVILSAQCTDKRVNQITPSFFERFPTARDLAQASIEEIYSLIRSCSYPNNKSKNLKGMAQTLVNEFQEVVPSDIGQLQKLPGVGRKTANVIASVVFNQPALAVDTHVFRVAARIGLSENSKNPLETERQLTRFIPENLRSIAHHWLILHGRYICMARKPLCMQCGFTSFCNFYNEITR